MAEKKNNRKTGKVFGIIFWLTNFLIFTALAGIVWLLYAAINGNGKISAFLRGGLFP